MRNIFILAILTWGSLVAIATAGGGPENVFLVINPKSPGSLNIGNTYIQLRHIPAGNVFYLPWDPNVEAISIFTIRSGILKPIFDAIRSRRLSAQIDYIVYSSDFPTTVYYTDELKKYAQSSSQNEVAIEDEEPPLKPFAPSIKLGKAVEDYPNGSLNGLTYLWQSVLNGDPNYLDLRSNRYLRLPLEGQKDKPTLGFRSSWQFGPKGELVESEGKSYMLSVVLGVTVGRGNTVEEVLNYLKSQRGGRRHASQRYDLFCQEQRQTLHGPP